jgi:hypothetical protein
VGSSHIGDLDGELLTTDLQDGEVPRRQGFGRLALFRMSSPVDHLDGFRQIGRQRGRDHLLLPVDDVDRGRGIEAGPRGVDLNPTGSRLTHVGVLASDQIDPVLVELAGDTSAGSGVQKVCTETGPPPMSTVARPRMRVITWRISSRSPHEVVLMAVIMNDRSGPSAGASRLPELP